MIFSCRAPESTSRVEIFIRIFRCDEVANRRHQKRMREMDTCFYHFPAAKIRNRESEHDLCVLLTNRRQSIFYLSDHEYKF